MGLDDDTSEEGVDRTPPTRAHRTMYAFDGDATDHELWTHARTLWDYHAVPESPHIEGDFALALGCCDIRVAERAARLVLDEAVDFMVATGAFGKVTKYRSPHKEAHLFAKRARELGVPSSKILVEPYATNTGENLAFSRDLLYSKGLEATRGVLVCKPPMRRRALAAAQRQWWQIDWSITSPQIDFHEYPNEEISLQLTIELMVGDLQRIELYAASGREYQFPEVVPDQVLEAYYTLVSAGYDRFLLDTTSGDASSPSLAATSQARMVMERATPVTSRRKSSCAPSSGSSRVPIA